ncbi:hypothetical protein HPB50_024951 [Hyalomma asiaticum]|uniref:Uncharacterized protein n=1 Tax=Hyalomma asiaticum TaxID=266040 RepID=A0ACB7TR38_HYAAI|nr:hypothetical protein HPB50_024951 [Hyalomma asiaticum]
MTQEQRAALFFRQEARLYKIRPHVTINLPPSLYPSRPEFRGLHGASVAVVPLGGRQETDAGATNAAGPRSPNGTVRETDAKNGLRSRGLRLHSVLLQRR